MSERAKPFHKKEVFTTTEAAKACYVSHQTIIRRFESGDLKGYKVPGSRFRRIPRKHLIQFMEENGIPTNGMFSDTLHLLTGDDLYQEIQAQNHNQLQTEQYDSAFAAGTAMSDMRGTLVVDGRVTTERERAAITKHHQEICKETKDKLKLIGVLTKENAVEGFDEVLFTSQSDDVLAQRIIDQH